MNIKTTRWVIRMIATVLALAVLMTPTSAAEPMGTSFTYQGQLKLDGVPVNGLADFDCSVWDSQAGGIELAGTTITAVAVTNGLFAIDVDFGPNLFDGSARWLEIQVAYPSGAPFTPLVGRQAITPVPYATMAIHTVGVDGHSLDASDGSPIDAVRVDYQGKVLMEKGGLSVFDDQGHGISLTSDTFDFIEGTSEDPVYSYSSIDDTHEFYTNGNRRMVIDADGHIGIGTSTPTNYLSLWGNANFMGNVGIGDATPTSTLSVGNGGKFRVSGFDGDLTFTDDMGSIKFAPTDGENAPMIQMFSTGINHGDRMVIGHSQTWPHGLQFEDSTATFHFINTSGGRFMSIDMGQSKVGIGEENPQAKLHIGGTPGVDGIMFPDGSLQKTAVLGGGSTWALAGNTGTTPGTDFVGTTDDQPLELHVNGDRALRIEPADLSPNLIGGHKDNMVSVDVSGATISGGGRGGAVNRVHDDGGAIGGGTNNQVGDDEGTTVDASDATVAGGFGNVATGLRSTVSGGRSNTASGTNSAVGGGYNNRALGNNSVVSGGANNNASANHATIAGGSSNTASSGMSTVGGGEYNTANGYLATVPGGSRNEASGTYSLAAGQRAQAIYEGSFVWSDMTTTEPDYFSSTGINQFLIKAAGGVGINTNAPGAALHIGGEAGVDGLMFPDGTLQTTAGAGGGSSLWSPSGDDIFYDTGNVGIRQSNPLTTLHLGGTPSVDGIIFPDGTLQTTAAVGGGGDSLWSPSGSDIFYNAGDVGIGTSSPGARLHVVDPVGFAIMGECLGEGNTGYLGHEHAGVYGESSSPGGYAARFEGRGYFSGNLRIGGNVSIGTSSSTRPLHVEGSGLDVIYAKTTATSTLTYAVRGDNNSIAGAGVSGEAMASTGRAAGVSGGAQSPNGVGVLGYNDNDVAPAIGVHGVTVSPTGFGGYFEGRGYFSGNVGIGTDSPVSKLHIVGPNDPVTGPILTMEASSSDSAESGRIRFGESTGNMRGGFIHYDGLANKLHIGTHLVANSDPADDVNSITISRLNGGVGIGTTSTSWPLNVGGDSFFDARVGIGGLSTGAKLHVEGNARVEGSIGIRTAPHAGIPLNIESSTILALQAKTSVFAGLAITGHSTAGGGPTIGVQGTADSPDGTGVRGKHTASTGTTAGVYGTTSAAEDFAAGVRGEATSATAWNITTGVTGISHAYSGIGVYGKATSTSTQGFPTSGGYFEADASNGVGVKAVGNGANGYGGYFVGRGYFSGNVGIGISNPSTKLDVAGWTRTEVLEITGGADLSEQFDVGAPGGQVEPGMVVVIDPDRPGKLILSDCPYDRKVAGVVSGAGGVQPGMIMGQRGTVADGEHPVALTGRVWTWCDATQSAIQPGDLLTTSSTFGHAMKAVDHAKAQGAIIGKAMSSLNEGTGLVLILVSLQ